MQGFALFSVSDLFNMYGFDKDTITIKNLYLMPSVTFLNIAMAFVRRVGLTSAYTIRKGTVSEEAFTALLPKLFSPPLGETFCGSPLQTPVSEAASQQAATAVFQLPGAPGMQREPRRAAVQACVREQRALSVPKKQPGGDFHPIGPCATAAAAAAARVRLGLRREPRDGALQ